MRKHKVSVVFSTRDPDEDEWNDDYVEQYRDEWTIEDESEANSFKLAIQNACLLVRLLWRKR